MEGIIEADSFYFNNQIILMKYTEVDIKLEKIIPFSEILIAKLNEIGYDSYEENKLGVKAYRNKNF